MSKKLYAIADNYFEDCVFASYDKDIVDRFMQYPPRKSRYDILVIKDKQLRKEFEKSYTDGEAYVVMGNDVILSLEYETYINTIPTTMISIQSGIKKIIDCIDLVKLCESEKETVDRCLEILYHVTSKYFNDQEEVIDHDKNVKKFISEEHI